MPGGDRTGPLGMGPRTGRAAGYCSGSGMPGYANFGFGRGYGMGYGRGRGFGRGRGPGMGYGRGWRNRNFAAGYPGWVDDYDYGYYPAYHEMPDPRATSRNAERDELRYLKREAKNLNQALSDINDRITQLEGERKSEG